MVRFYNLIISYGRNIYISKAFDKLYPSMEIFVFKKRKLIPFPVTLEILQNVYIHQWKHWIKVKKLYFFELRTRVALEHHHVFPKKNMNYLSTKW